MKQTTLQEKEEKIRQKADKQIARLRQREEKISVKQAKRTDKKVVPIFYASDDTYLPYLAVSLSSLKKNANKAFRYEIYVLHTGVQEENERRVKTYQDENFVIRFVDVSERLEEVKRSLQLRDYYTGATYYRIFIAEMFPQYDKALYLDGDTVILGDIAKLYNVPLNDNLVGAVTDGVVSSTAVFQAYTREVLGIESNRYFNAGVLVMNLKKFREENFYEKFRNLLLEYKFSVAQDQDYLNVLCKDRVRYLSSTWNTMPIGGEKRKLPALIHYNLTAKPWRYASIPYAKYFWTEAEHNEFAAELRAQFGSYSDERREQDARTEQSLIALAIAETKREDNFIRARRAKQNEADRYALTTKSPIVV
ncbi:MAG: glycosyltransferase family 8 protein [Clostridia bacterium]|nr:glycosyltransferase family 8 protein [Clostridia bacterium]